MGETPHIVEVHLLRYLKLYIDEEGAEECGECEQAHGHGPRRAHSTYTLCTYQACGEILAFYGSCHSLAFL